MAAIALPIIEALAPTIITLITGLVHKQAPVAEASNGPGTGPVKFADVFSAVMIALQNAAAAGQIPKALPSDEAVKAIIQAVVTSMKLSGTLIAPPSGSAPQAITLTAGQSVTITVA